MKTEKHNKSTCVANRKQGNAKVLTRKHGTFELCVKKPIQHTQCLKDDSNTLNQSFLVN